MSEPREDLLPCCCEMRVPRDLMMKHAAGHTLSVDGPSQGYVGSGVWRGEFRTILVGEANPCGGDPAYALYPLPENSAGGRLCRLIMGLQVRDYIRRFDRRNPCATKWSTAEARRTAGEILGAPSGCTVVLFGAKACTAFNRGFDPYTIERDPGPSRTLVILPHPSGLSRAWNEPGSFERARAVLAEAGVL